MMFDPFTLALIGGGLGLLSNRKNPIQGGLLGAGLGAAGGALLNPALAAAAPAPVADAVVKPVADAAVSTAAINPVTNPITDPFALQMQKSLESVATQAPSPVADAAIKPVSAWDSAMSGIKGFGETIKPVTDVMKPVGQAAQTAAAVKSMMPEQKPIMASPIVQAPAAGVQGLTQLASTYNQIPQLLQQEDELRKRQRMGLLSQMGMKNGLA